MRTGTVFAVITLPTPTKIGETKKIQFYQKSLIREIEAENPEETMILANLALCHLDTEISLLQSQKVRYKEKFVTIDAAMLAEISEQSDGQIHEKLQLWKEDTKREEEKSIRLWEKQQH